LEEGYWRAYREFYRWRSIMSGAATKADLISAARHVAYAGGWKKFEPLWDLVIRARRIAHLLPVLEGVLTGFGKHPPTQVRLTPDLARREEGRVDLRLTRPTSVANAPASLHLEQLAND
jgi:hypothetical protein